MAFLINFVCAAVASAQPSEGAGQISFGVGTTFGERGTAVLLDGSAAFRVTRHFGLEIDFSAIQDLELRSLGLPVPTLTLGVTAPTGIPIPIPPRIPVRIDRSADLRVFTTSAFGEFPTPKPSIRVYVLAGGGIGSVRQETRFAFTGSITGLPTGVRVPVPARQTSSTTDLALVAGTGVDFQIWRRVAPGVDARYLRVAQSDKDLNLARVGGRVSFRF